MPYVDNQGVRIHYQVEGEGPSLVLQHGGAGSLKDWHQFGYVDALKNNYSLILIDARGRGESDKPHEGSAYMLEHQAADIVAVLGDLQIDKSHYWGYSMGGRVGFAMAKYAPERVHTFVIGGAHAFARSADKFFSGLDPSDPEAFIAAYEAMVGEPFTPEWKARILSNDLHAMVAAAKAQPSMEEVLPTMTVPCLLYIGENDPRLSQVQDCAKRMPHATVVSLPDLNHAEAYRSSDVVLPHVTKFLQENS